MFEKLKPLLVPGNAVALLVAALSVGALLWIRQQPGLNVFSEAGLEALLDKLGWQGPLLYMLLLALSVVVSQVPGVPLAIAAGAIWGPLAAGVYSVVGGFIGGMIAYFLGRTLGRSVIKVLTGKVVYFTKERGEFYLGSLVFISRMLPILSFDLISYAAGFTKLSLPIYALATFFGMIPSTFLLTYLGSAFSISLPYALGMSVLVAALLLVLPFLIRRGDWLGLKDIVRIE